MIPIEVRQCKKEKLIIEGELLCYCMVNFPSMQKLFALNELKLHDIIYGICRI